MAQISDKFKQKCSRGPELMVRALVDSIPYPLIVRDLEYTIGLANKAALEYFGGELIGRRCYEAQRSSECPCEDCPAREAARTGHPAHRELRDERTGEHVDIDVYPMFDGEGAFCSIIETTRIVTKYVNARHKIQQLVQRLTAQNQQLNDWGRRITFELNVAQEIQRTLVPQHPVCHRRICFEFLYQPSGEVGGDMYDVFSLDEDRTGVLIADASGHGIGAAFLAVMVKMAFLSEDMAKDSPKAALEALNEQLLRLVPAGQFLTAFYGVFDARTRQLRYALAGHPRPMLLRRGAGSVELLDADGFVLGSIGGVEMEERSVRLGSGDRLLLYTDGVEDIANAEGERYGRARLEKALLGSAAGGLPELLKGVVADVRAFAGDTPADDDLTLIIAEAADAPAEKT